MAATEDTAQLSIFRSHQFHAQAFPVAPRCRIALLPLVPDRVRCLLAQSRIGPFGAKTAPCACARRPRCTAMRAARAWHGACGCLRDDYARSRHLYADTIDGFAKIAEKKLESLRRHPGGFFVSSMLAGAYVGMGIILIFTLGNQVPPEFQKL